MADLKHHSGTDQCLVVSVRPNNGGLFECSGGLRSLARSTIVR